MPLSTTKDPINPWCGLPSSQCRCSDLREQGEYHYQRSVNGKSHKEAAEIAYKAAYPEAHAVKERLLGRKEIHATCSNPHHGFGAHPRFKDCEDWQG